MVLFHWCLFSLTPHTLFLYLILLLWSVICKQLFFISFLIICQLQYLYYICIYNYYIFLSKSTLYKQLKAITLKNFFRVIAFLYLFYQIVSELFLNERSLFSKSTPLITVLSFTILSFTILSFTALLCTYTHSSKNHIKTRNPHSLPAENGDRSYARLPAWSNSNTDHPHHPETRCARQTLRYPSFLCPPDRSVQ